MTTDDLQISWLHCNVCHRAFEGHNKLKLNGDRLVLAQSDLFFYFSGCGHFLCENCINSDKQHGNSLGNQRCKICGEQTQYLKITSTIPEKVSMYLKPPISLLEDSLSIMMFQLNNANKLIAALRAKIGNQKDLLTRAKVEISQVKELKEKIKVLEDDRYRFNAADSVQFDPNETLRIPSEFRQHNNQIQFTNKSNQLNRDRDRRDKNNIQYSPFLNYQNPTTKSSNFLPTDSPLIHVNGRLSLKSPSINGKNYNSNTTLNSPYPQYQNNIKSSRQAYKRPPP